MTDVCVPISNLPEIITKTKEDIGNLSLIGEHMVHRRLWFRNSSE